MVPGFGNRRLGLDPPVDDPRTLFCVGEDIKNFIFTDATVFDCQLAAEPDLPNIRPRNVQFVYGTHNPAPGIPNVFIDVNGTPVQVTDNNGVGIQGYGMSIRMGLLMALVTPHHQDFLRVL